MRRIIMQMFIVWNCILACLHYFFRNEIDFNLIVAHVEIGFAYGKIYIDVVVLRTHALP